MVVSNPEPVNLNDLDELNVIDGVYNCLCKQGEGGQADVWFASNDRFGEIAIKVFKWGTREN